MSNLNFESLPQVVHELSVKIDNFALLLKSTTQRKDQNDLLNTKEAAKFLNLSVPTLYSKASKKEIPYMKQGKRLYFSKTELVNYIKSGKVLSDREIEEQADNFLSNSKK
jgi:excisionase family DNA binding protein